MSRDSPRLTSPNLHLRVRARLCLDKDVVNLDVSVYDVVQVQKLQTLYDLRYDVSGLAFCHSQTLYHVAFCSTLHLSSLLHKPFQVSLVTVVGK